MRTDELGDAPSVVLIGAGNVASVLGAAFRAADVPVLAVYSATAERARLLAGSLACSCFWGDDFPSVAADIYLVSVSDRVCESVCAMLAGRGMVVAHTSGSVPLPSFSESESGVFYPLQTFTSGREVSLKEVPFFLESSSERALGVLRSLALRISSHVYDLDSARRSWLHLLGVLSSNFVNHLLALSEEICKSRGLEFPHLESLVRETVDKAFSLGPIAAQTGPAVRGDMVTLRRHEGMLAESLPHLLPLYTTISQSIIGRHGARENDG